MELLQIPWFDWLDETVALPPALTNFLEPCASFSKALFESFVPRGFSLKSNSALPPKSNDFFEKDVLALRSTDVSRGLGVELCTLEGHSNIEDEEKCADGQENEQIRKGRRRMPWNTATAFCLSSASQSWVRLHEPYSD